MRLLRHVFALWSFRSISHPQRLFSAVERHNSILHPVFILNLVSNLHLHPYRPCTYTKHTKIFPLSRRWCLRPRRWCSTSLGGGRAGVWGGDKGWLWDGGVFVCAGGGALGCLAEDCPSDSLKDFSPGCAGWAEDWRPGVYQRCGNDMAGRDRAIQNCETVQRPGHPGSLQCRLGLMPARHVPVTCVLATPRRCRAEGKHQCGPAVKTMRTLCDGRHEHQCGLAPLDTQFGGGVSAGALSHPGLFAWAARAHRLQSLDCSSRRPAIAVTKSMRDACCV